MLTKIISGAQTGADQGALEATKQCGLQTGGWIPKGCRTEVGYEPYLRDKYQLTEHESSDYVPRTGNNVRDSDGTLIFTNNLKSAGTKCTKRWIKLYKKPSLIVKDMSNIDQVVQWVKENDIRTLNVAGNRESSNPGLQEAVRNFTMKIIAAMNL